MVCTANNVATAARRTVSAAHALAAGRPVSRSRAQQRVQPGQRGHNADRQFQAQQRGRKPAEPARDAAGHHRGVADGQPGAHALRHGRSPHPPAADNQLRERIPAGAEPENDGSDRALHRIAPSGTPVTSTLSPKLPGTQSPRSRRQRPGTTNYRPTDASRRLTVSLPSSPGATADPAPRPFRRTSQRSSGPVPLGRRHRCRERRPSGHCRCRCRPGVTSVGPPPKKMRLPGWSGSPGPS